MIIDTDLKIAAVCDGVDCGGEIEVAVSSGPTIDCCFPANNLLRALDWDITPGGETYCKKCQNKMKTVAGVSTEEA